MKALPSNEALWKELSPKGVHMFFVHGQDEDKEWMQDYAKKRGLTFPIPMLGECEFTEYDRGERNSIPYAFVIGPDGIVAWQGREGYGAQVRAQLARIKYPMLKRMDVDPAVAPAAQLFENGEYADAREAAQTAKDAAGENEAALADAEHVLRSVVEHLEDLRAKIDVAKIDRRYHEAIAMLDQLSGKPYKGLPECDAAKEELKTLKSDKEVKSELKAWDQLEKTLEANKKAKDDADRRKNLEKFIKKYEGSAAADVAAALLEE